MLDVCCFPLHSLLGACLCLYMQGSDSLNLLCAFLLLLDVLQRNLHGRAQAYFNAAVAWVLFCLKGEPSVGREPLVCWFDLNLE